MSNQIFPYTNHSRFEKPDIYIKGENDCVWTNDGKKYIDCNSGLWNVNFGYNNKSYDLAQNDIHFYPTHFWSSTESAENAATKICNWFGYNKVFFGHSGRDAIDTSINISKFFNNKSDVLAYSKGYHGTSIQASVYECYKTLISAVNNQTSAVIIEPLMITKGVIEFDESVLEELFELKNKYNFVIIFDETVTALGRADYSFKWRPDILIASKGLTNGMYPLSAVLVNEEIGTYIKNTNKVFSHGYTMSGHPITCNMLSTSIDLVQDNKKLEKQFRDLFDSKNLSYYNKGLVFGIQVPDGIYVRRQLHKKGYLIRQHDNTLIFVPMFTTNINNYVNFADLVATF